MLAFQTTGKVDGILMASLMLSMDTTIESATHDVQSTSTFISMTLDIHILVLQHLDPSDIVSLRKTCKTLQDATHQRIVWINALTKMCLENTVYLHSYPVANMSDSDLEYAASNPERWSRYIRKHEDENDFTPPSLQRTLPFPDDLLKPRDVPHVLEQLYLIPGGRFLVTLLRGRIQVWDIGIIGITGPKSEPIADISSKGQWFSTHPSLDGEGLRIITSCTDFDNNSRGFEVFEIFPWKPDAKLQKIATLTVQTQYHLYYTSVVGDLLILVCGPVLKIWNFITHGWATWNTGNTSKQILATDKCIILVESDSLSVWDIPALSNDVMGEYLAQEPEAVTQPRARIPYPTDFGSTDLSYHHCAGLCDWYTGSSQPLWFDFISDGPSGQVFHRFKINIADLDLPAIPLHAAEGTFHIPYRPSMSISAYRVCGGDISILTWGVNGVALHVGSALPDDTHHALLLSRERLAGLERRQISFCPISGRLCFIGRGDIRIMDYSTVSLPPFLN